VVQTGPLDTSFLLSNVANTSQTGSKPRFLTLSQLGQLDHFIVQIDKAIFGNDTT
jgi:hypothetical protein